MKKSRLTLIILSLLILLVCVGVTVCLLFFNYQNVRLFKEAQRNFQCGDEASLSLAEEQLLQVVRNDSDNEAAFVMLGEIARKRKIYPEQVYYCYMIIKRKYNWVGLSSRLNHPPFVGFPPKPPYLKGFPHYYGNLY